MTKRIKYIIILQIILGIIITVYLINKINFFIVLFFVISPIVILIIFIQKSLLNKSKFTLFNLFLLIPVIFVFVLSLINDYYLSKLEEFNIEISSFCNEFYIINKINYNINITEKHAEIMNQITNIFNNITKKGDVEEEYRKLCRLKSQLIQLSANENQNNNMYYFKEKHDPECNKMHFSAILYVELTEEIKKALEERNKSLLEHIKNDYIQSLQIFIDKSDTLFSNYNYYNIKEIIIYLNSEYEKTLNLILQLEKLKKKIYLSKNKIYVPDFNIEEKLAQLNSFTPLLKKYNLLNNEVKQIIKQLVQKNNSERTLRSRNSSNIINNDTIE